MEQLVNFVIRPPRADYTVKYDLLEQQFKLKGRWFQRKDLEIKNKKNLVLQCSHYVPMHVPEGTVLPCVIYCHGNSGCRADASEAAIILLPSNITLFTLDLSGSGLSEGEHVTLGWNEKEDLRAVVDYLRAEGNVSCIGLWGRSMGAVTCLLYGAEDPSIAGMVLDSPFSNLVELMMELVDTYKYPLPKFTVKLAIQHMRRVIRKKANFDIMDLDVIQVAKCSFIPALFGHAEDDDFIQPHHSDRIYDAYVGDKNIIKFDGDHNSPRPQFYFDSITIFFHNVLNPPEVGYDEHYYTAGNGLLHEDVLEETWGPLSTDSNFAIPPADSITNGREVAIDQVRRRRPMSRIEVPSNAHDEKSQFEGNASNLYIPSSSAEVNNNEHLRKDPHLTTPGILDDSQYLEYTIDNFSDIPYSAEDEDRMIMKAIMESLKDMDVHSTPEDVKKNGEGTALFEESKACSSQSHCSSSSSSERTELAGGSNSNVIPNNVSQRSTDSLSHDELSGSAQSTSNASSSMQGEEAEAGTRARLVVQRNPSGHILDGIVQRWGSFFKGSG